MTVLHRAARFLGLIPSRHAAGSVTGWSSLARIRPAAPTAYFTRRRSTPLALCPVSDDVIPFADYRHPYDPPKGSAA